MTAYNLLSVIKHNVPCPNVPLIIILGGHHALYLLESSLISLLISPVKAWFLL